MPRWPLLSLLLLRLCPVCRSRSRSALRCCAVCGGPFRAPPAPLLRRAHGVRAYLGMASLLARPARLAVVAFHLALAARIARSGLRDAPQVQHSVDFLLLWRRRMRAVAAAVLDIHSCDCVGRPAGHEAGRIRGAAAYVPSVRGRLAKDLEERGGWLGCSARDDPQRRLSPSRRTARGGRIRHDCSSRNLCRDADCGPVSP